MYIRQDSINNIIRLLGHSIPVIKLSNSVNLTDVDIHAETFYRELLNRIFLWNLRSLNTPKDPQYPAIDLGDLEVGISVQVTASDRREKVQDTLDKFHAHQLYQEYKQLKILVITDKATFKKDFKSVTLAFDKQHDILDVSDLIREIQLIGDVGRISEIEAFLKSELERTVPPPKVQPEVQVPVQPIDPTDSLLRHLNRKNDLNSYMMGAGVEDAHREIVSLFNGFLGKASALSSINVDAGAHGNKLVARRTEPGACSIEMEWQQRYRNRFDDAQLMVSLWKGPRLMPGRSEAIFDLPFSDGTYQCSWQQWILKATAPKQWIWDGGGNGTNYTTAKLVDQLYLNFIDLIKAHDK